MADRVYPLQEPTSPATENTESETAPLHPSFKKPPPPPPGTYIIHVPKDQILRLPPPEHAKKITKFQNRPKRRRAIRRSCLTVTSAFLVLILAVAVSVAVIYLVFKPRFPSYSVDSVSITGLSNVNVTVSSPVIDTVIRADNSANKMVGIEYRNKGNIAVVYSGGVNLGSGPWPAFYQAPKNVTVFSTALKGEGVILTATERQEMATQQSKGAVPLTVDVDVPVRVKFGALTTWTIPVKARCDVTVSSLTAKAAVTSKSCSVKAKVLLWWW